MSISPETTVCAAENSPREFTEHHCEEVFELPTDPCLMGLGYTANDEDDTYRDDCDLMAHLRAGNQPISSYLCRSVSYLGADGQIAHIEVPVFSAGDTGDADAAADAAADMDIDADASASIPVSQR
jgi:hypothetical protein